ncbi:MAG: UDP-N-acetylglucosamine 1-carboxyvinyltransferase [Alphaproteobacteria bacterium]|nr:UDP-N-acetylglucosamine 1-carboxyvinyltransferase [Alphaproteobacteria bacterium]MBN9568383.1 UDP-N-acetylglucosamine 1-carboxyvinyltransferase [Alphaproteobacteria bacterium]OJW28800.1 MAG: UDP-N-acetylglucosamine 1-carboxyvinyltransferase [Rhodospirillales bacterium 69-11]
MDKIRVIGGSRLKGEIPISGAKNAALKLMAATLLTDQPMTLTNMPNLADVAFMADLLRGLGVSVRSEGGNRLGEGARYRLHAGTAVHTTAEYDVVRKMRASFQVLGPLLARHGKAKISLPGGCAIGARPVDFHIKGFEAMGARIDLADGYVIASAPAGLKGTTFEFPFASVGATENLMTGAVLAKGRTVLKNAAREPETQDLGHCLIEMGAKISGLGTSEIVIDGVEALNGVTYAVMPDRIEAGTYAIATAIAGGEVELVGAQASAIGALIALLRQAGTEVQETNRGLSVHRNGVCPTAVDVNTGVFPAFPTDLQAQFMALMATADGTSHIRETVFENRFMHVPELLRMGADIKVEGDLATVRGVPRLKGAPVMATDLRASVSLVLAALAAEGETIVNRVYHLDRGFERLEEKFSAVGAQVERIQ